MHGDAVRVDVDAVAAREGKLREGGGNSAFGHVVEGARAGFVGAYAAFCRDTEPIHEPEGLGERVISDTARSQLVSQLLGKDGGALDSRLLDEKNVVARGHRPLVDETVAGTVPTMDPTTTGRVTASVISV